MFLLDYGCNLVALLTRNMKPIPLKAIAQIL